VEKLKNYQLMMSVLINIIMLFCYFRRVEYNITIPYIIDIPYISEFADSYVVMKILGYIQLLLACIVLFFWFVIDCPLVIKGKWRNVMIL